MAEVMPNTTAYRDNGAWPGTVYYYRARAYNALGASGFSNITNVKALDLCVATIIGWGLNTSGETTPPAGLTGVVAVAPGYSSSLRLKSDRAVLCWGDHSYVQTN